MQISLAILVFNLFLILIILHASKSGYSPVKSWFIIFLTAGTALLSVAQVSSLLSLFAAVSFTWALVNNGRLISKRRRYAQTYKVVLEGWWTFMLLYFALLAFDYVVVDSILISVLSIVSLGVAIATLFFTIYHVFSYRIGKTSEILETSMPSVTLAVPARNETHAIKESLTQALASDYPKLEILVIDDCSQDRTPQIIRDFAHEGVRFIQGAAPDEHWLGKNASYKALTEEASGEYLIFAGVDVRFSKKTIDRLIEFAIENEIDMLSVMPQRNHFDFLANFLQTTRYYFQFILPWEVLPVSPVLSSLWLIKRETLLELGNFNSVPNLVVPERFFANELGKQHKYRFLVSDSGLGVTSRKRTSSQMETATRTLYPLFRNNPILIFLASSGLLMLLVLPFAVAVLNATGASLEGYHFSILTAGLLIVTNLIVYTRFNASAWFIGLFNFPFIITLEAALLQWSMFKYEYSSVVWKDRNICTPVLNPPLKRQRDNPL